LINDLGESPISLTPGDLIEVEITEALPHDLVGKMVGMVRKWDEKTLSSPGLTRAHAQERPSSPGVGHSAEG
jgi:hypothetical protein